MSSIKVLLRLNKMKADGTCPIVIQIINNRKLTQKFLGSYVKPEFWDNKNSLVTKSHPNSARINHLIQVKIAEMSAILLEAETNNIELTKRQLKYKIKHQNKSSFHSLADEHLSDLYKLEKFNQHSGEKPRIKHFLSFLEGEDISFQNINVPLLKKYMVYLKTEKNLNDRTIMNCLIVIRTIFNKAISEGLVESKYYPFGVGKIQIKFMESRKIGLTPDEVKLLEDAKFEDDSAKFHALNVWLTSFYLAGVRIADIIQLKWSDINDGRIIYIMGKNQKVVSFKMPDKANTIITYYKSKKTDSDFVFPYLSNDLLKNKKQLNAKTRSVNGIINKNLKRIAKEIGIDKNLTMHISRHTFGQIAGDKIAPQLLQKLYRHTDLKTTIGYQSNFIHNDVDDALTEILNF